MLRHLRIATLLLIASTVPVFAKAQAAPIPAATVTSPKVLNATEAGSVLPPAVFFRGQSASTQARNSGGVQFSKDALMLAVLVDTSGYSSSLQQKYQAYLITEVPVVFEDHRLPPGAYGCGFIAGDNFIVMDIGGHDLFTVKSTHDATLHRPTPLQVLASPANPQRYRLYAGRNFVEFAAAGQ
ncbi:hypothetical protein [Edaphobacter bradus]|uniref:hypothetical protein n=1 Tax=Edaphobacter bradus TaxID=2259016 RepID=UPI0021DF9579|nr:hypothetical protein [Edaphobacter bradus]